MTTSIQTYQCAYCGRQRQPEELQQSLQTGWLLCKDSDACDKAIQRQGRAYETAILLELEGLEVKKSECIHQLVQVRHEYKLPDPIAEKNRVEMAKLDAQMSAEDDQC